MRKILDRINDQPMEAVLGLILMLQTGLIMYGNLVRIDQNIDCDSAMLMRHIVQMWREKTPVIPEWSYITTMEWDCTTLFALPLYGLVHDIFLACALSNILLLFLFLAALFFLFQGQRPVYPLLCANLLCIPYRVGQLDYFNMLFFSGTQYIVKIMIPILLIGVLCAAERQRGEGTQKTGRLRFFALLYLCLLLVSCMSSGVYAAVCGVFPVWIVYFGYHFLRWEKVSVRSILLCVCSALILVFGVWVNQTVMQGTRGESMVLCSVYQMLYNMSSCFWGIFELFGGLVPQEDIAVFSIAGVSRLGKFCLVGLLLGCAAAALYRCLKKQGDLRMFLLLAVALWNYFILNVAYVKAGSPTYEYRYHLIGMIPVVCLAVIVLLDALFRTERRQQLCLFGLGAAAVVFLSALSYREFFLREDQQAQLKEFCAYCGQLGAETIYIYGDSSDAEVCRIWDLDHEYLYLTQEGVTWVFDYYAYYIGEPMQEGNVIVAVSDARYDMGDSFELADRRLTRFDTAAGRSLYYVEN